MRTDLRTRATDLAELMDGPGCSREELRGALRFLRWINGASLARWMLGREVRRALGPREGSRPVRVLDVATGGADVPGYFRSAGVAGTAVGVDVNPEILGLARAMSPGVLLVRADCFRLPFADGAFDAATCAQFFHHLEDEECVRLLAEMRRVARGVVVMDLARSVWLYRLVWLMTRVAGNRLTRVDGPVSVRRAFTLAEAEGLVARAGLRGTVGGRVGWRWCLRVE